MAKHKDPLLVALLEGKSYTWTTPDGGDFASMRKAVKHGQTLTMSPVEDPGEVQVGDIVFVKWRQGYLFHMVGEIQGDQFLIVNSLGKVNGWVSGADILGRVTQIVDPEERPAVPVMLEQLRAAYHSLIQQELPNRDDTQRLLTIVDDLQWYAGRIGEERWDQMPRSNQWSFAQILWTLVKQAKAGQAPLAKRVHYFIDCGKECVGSASKIYALFEYSSLM
jgi:hypothetical protein